MKVNLNLRTAASILYYIGFLSEVASRLAISLFICCRWSYYCLADFCFFCSEYWLSM